MLLGFITLITLPSILWLYALADATINRFGTFGAKLIWILVLIFFPPLGTLLYYLIGRGQRRTYYPVGRVVLICILLFPIVSTIVYYMQQAEQGKPAEEPPAKSIRI